jgi:hypothetical protein
VLHVKTHTTQTLKKMASFFPSFLSQKLSLLQTQKKQRITDREKNHSSKLLEKKQKTNKNEDNRKTSSK